MKNYIKGENFYLVKEQNGRTETPIIIKSSGYTIDDQAINGNWFHTQLRTLTHSNRSNLSDPLIFENSKNALNPYIKNESVYSLYLTPACKGIKYFQEEFSDFINALGKDFSFVGFSKGGLLMSGLDIKRTSKFVFVAPTFGCIFGNKEMVFNEIDKYKSCHILNIFQTIELILYKKIVQLIESWRPVDIDMSPNSQFLKSLNLKGLSRHRVLLITSTSPKIACNLQDAFFRHFGRYVGLDEYGDCMMSLENQSKVEKYAEQVYNVFSTHPTVLEKATTIMYISEFLND